MATMFIRTLKRADKCGHTQIFWCVADDEGWVDAGLSSPVDPNKVKREAEHIARHRTKYKVRSIVPKGEERYRLKEYMERLQEIGDWIDKRIDTVPCSKCGESGTYRWAGRYGIKEGICFDCQGKGSQTPYDRRRDKSYHQHQNRRRAQLGLF